MTADPQQTTEIDSAQVLFIDIVGYSALPGMADQLSVLEDLQEVVRRALESARAPAGEEAIRLPTGDGEAAAVHCRLGRSPACARAHCRHGGRARGAPVQARRRAG